MSETVWLLDVQTGFGWFRWYIYAICCRIASWEIPQREYNAPTMLSYRIPIDGQHLLGAQFSMMASLFFLAPLKGLLCRGMLRHTFSYLLDSGSILQISCRILGHVSSYWLAVMSMCGWSGNQSWQLKTHNRCFISLKSPFIRHVPLPRLITGGYPIWSQSRVRTILINLHVYFLDMVEAQILICYNFTLYMYTVHSPISLVYSSLFVG